MISIYQDNLLDELHTKSKNDKKYQKELSSEKVLILNFFRFDKKRTVDLSFLEHMPNLETLNITCAKLVNYNYISQLKNIKNLTLEYSLIKDLTFLKDLTSLEYLNILSNPVRDYAPILYLKNIKYIEAVESEVSFCLFKYLKLEAFNRNQIIHKYWRCTSSSKNAYCFGPTKMSIHLIRYNNTWGLYVSGSLYILRGCRDDVMQFISTFVVRYGKEEFKEFMDEKVFINMNYKNDINTMFEGGII